MYTYPYEKSIKIKVSWQANFYTLFNAFSRDLRLRRTLFLYHYRTNLKLAFESS